VALTLATLLLGSMRMAYIMPWRMWSFSSGAFEKTIVGSENLRIWLLGRPPYIYIYIYRERERKRERDHVSQVCFIYNLFKICWVNRIKYILNV